MPAGRGANRGHDGTADCGRDRRTTEDHEAADEEDDRSAVDPRDEGGL